MIAWLRDLINFRRNARENADLTAYVADLLRAIDEAYEAGVAAGKEEATT